jgi:hypothetical protein
MAPSYTGPKGDELDEALTAVVRQGLRPDLPAERGGALLDLRLVEKRLNLDEAPGADGRNAANAEALTVVLREAVEAMGPQHGKYRRLLTSLIPLNIELRSKGFIERLTAAGRAMKEGRKPVPADTVRKHHQQPAIRMLIRKVVEMEALARGEEASEGDWRPSHG